MSSDRLRSASSKAVPRRGAQDLERLIAARLGNPTVDPHGDPIPTVEFGIEERSTHSLDELAVGAAGRFVRVSDSDPEMLRYLAERGIALGDHQLLSKVRLRATLMMLGPAFVASIAYVDAGNFATNVEGGAPFGYLLWVVLLANVMAMLVQYLSARLGIIADQNLPQTVRTHTRGMPVDRAAGRTLHSSARNASPCPRSPATSPTPPGLRLRGPRRGRGRCGCD
ncbi:MAG TPA: Nramp family divalent metal transporter [Solirubrobacteraceae bacterium]|nr:Nramp family divalent metal transporter [Solirubrobacteraceae bacterium]